VSDGSSVFFSTGVTTAHLAIILIESLIGLPVLFVTGNEMQYTYSAAEKVT